MRSSLAGLVLLINGCLRPAMDFNVPLAKLDGSSTMGTAKIRVIDQRPKWQRKIYRGSPSSRRASNAVAWIPSEKFTPRIEEHLKAECRRVLNERGVRAEKIIIRVKACGVVFDGRKGMRDAGSELQSREDARDSEFFDEHRDGIWAEIAYLGFIKPLARLGAFLAMTPMDNPAPVGDDFDDGLTCLITTRVEIHQPSGRVSYPVAVRTFRFPGEQTVRNLKNVSQTAADSIGEWGKELGKKLSESPLQTPLPLSLD